MNTRILNILLAFFVTLLAINFFLPNPNKNSVPTSEISLHAMKDSYVSPDIPVIEIQNTTLSGIIVDTCRDITIQRDYNKLTGIPKEFCKTITIASGAKEKIDFNPIYKLFHAPGKYEFQLSVNGTVAGAGIIEETP